MRHCGFEPADKAHGVLHASLCVGAKRPIAKAEAASYEIDEWIEREQKLIAKVAGEREPLQAAATGHHHVELVAVNNQDAFTGGCYMNCALLDLDIAVDAAKAGHEFIVVSRDVNNARSLAGFPQNFLDYVIMLLRPINSATQRPNIDQIADDVESAEIILAQKIE